MNSANKRIAKNTIFMYIRLFTTMFVGLYTSRVVLQLLGISDYGLYNVVGGLIGLFGFISGSIGAATSRFFNTEMGKPDGDVNKSFNVNLAIYCLLAVGIFFLAETVGLWYIHNRLVVEFGKMSDAVFIYQISVFTTCMGLMNSPYYCLFSAHERFKFLAVLDIFNVFLRLGCVVLLQLYSGEYILRLYSLIMCLTTANTFVVYHWIAARDWPDITKLKVVKGWHNYKDVLVFSNWSLLATLSFMLRGTGTDLLINYFFGTAVNGAFAISKTVNNYVMQFSSNFDGASGPQIIQAYASGDRHRYEYLVNKLGRYSLLLFEVIFFPLYIELNFLLHLWLGDVPDGVLIYCQLNLILAAVALTCGGIVQLINASGKIKWFKINTSLFFISCVPVGYLLLKHGAPAYTMIVLFLFADIVQRIIQLILLKMILGFNSWLYVKEAYLRPTIIAIIMCFAMAIYWRLGIESPWLKMLSVMLCFLLTSVAIYFVGMTEHERSRIGDIVKSKLL